MHGFKFVLRMQTTHFIFFAYFAIEQFNAKIFFEGLKSFKLVCLLKLNLNLTEVLSKF